MASENIQILDDSTFDAVVLQSGKPTLVDFWAPWCGPCKAIAPMLEELAGELAGKIQICKVDTDTNIELAHNYNISAIPTLLLFKGGELQGRVEPWIGKAGLKAKLESLA